MDRGTLCAAIGSELYWMEYIKIIFSKWRDELLLLSKITKIQPKAANSAYINVSKSKCSFFKCNALTLQNHMMRIKDVMRKQFFPEITGESSVSESLQQL